MQLTVNHHNFPLFVTPMIIGRHSDRFIGSRVCTNPHLNTLQSVREAMGPW